jgi:hypothetical protein
VDYSDGLYGHSLVAHGKVLVLFGGLLSGCRFSAALALGRPLHLRPVLQAGIKMSVTGC